MWCESEARKTRNGSQQQFDSVRQGHCKVALSLHERKRVTETARHELEKLSGENVMIARISEAVGCGTACVLFASLGDPKEYHCGEAYTTVTRDEPSLLTHLLPGAIRPTWLFSRSRTIPLQSDPRVLPNSIIPQNGISLVAVMP